MKKFLIVDDIKGWRDFHTNAVKSIYGTDIEIMTADSAKNAYNLVLENNNLPYDFILTDLQMEDRYEPLYAGEWLIEQIKLLPKYCNTKIIIISAAYNISYIAEKYDVDFIPKASARESLEEYKSRF